MHTHNHIVYVYTLLRVATQLLLSMVEWILESLPPDIMHPIQISHCKSAPVDRWTFTLWLQAYQCSFAREGPPPTAPPLLKE